MSYRMSSIAFNHDDLVLVAYLWLG